MTDQNKPGAAAMVKSRAARAGEFVREHPVGSAIAAMALLFFGGSRYVAHVRRHEYRHGYRDGRADRAEEYADRDDGSEESD